MEPRQALGSPENLAGVGKRSLRADTEAGGEITEGEKAAAIYQSERCCDACTI